MSLKALPFLVHLSLFPVFPLPLVRSKMEDFRMRLLLLSISIFLLCYTNAEDPLRNVNLSPFWQWRSAWDCMQNVSKACTSNKDRLTITGVLNVSAAEISNYCENGCADHTKYVLACISWVKRDFWFANGATVRNLTDTINHGCATNTSLNTNFKSSGIRTSQKFLIPLIASLATATVVIIFKI